jgi:preprotein translocase subunit SecF
MSPSDAPGEDEELPEAAEGLGDGVGEDTGAEEASATATATATTETAAVTVTTETPEEAAEELEEEEIERIASHAKPPRDERGPSAVQRLYHGGTSFDFVGRRRWWFALSAAIILAGALSLGIRGLNLGIDFKGGTAWTVKTTHLSQSQADKLASAAGLSQPTVQILGSGSQKTVEVQGDLNGLSTKAKTRISTAVTDALAKAAGVPVKTISRTTVGPTWGGQVTKKAVEALIVFFIAVAIYISFRFEPKMAVAAFLAMVHDLLVTVGVYSLLGFQVSPDTVIAILTILGYSLYDTVVVFDRVRDNMKGFGASGRMTYSEMINLSMNQTLARSINTSLVAILPVLSVLLIGAELLGATTLQNYGLALTVGLLSGAYSSIFIASPILAMVKEREPRYVAIRQRLESRGDRIGLLTPAAAAALVGAAATTGRAGKAAPARGRAGTLRPGAAKGGAKATTATAAAAGAAGARASGTRPAGAGARPSAGGGARRPPPRPRKGGGKGKKRR